MNFRLYSPADYPLIANWWKKRDFVVIPSEALPTIGYVVNDEACGFLYTTDSSLAVMEWLVTNPDADKKSRIESLKFVINLLNDAAKEMNYKMIFSSINNKTLLSIYEECGFVKTDTDMVNFIKKVS